MNGRKLRAQKSDAKDLRSTGIGNKWFCAAKALRLLKYTGADKTRECDTKGVHSRSVSLFLLDESALSRNLGS